MKLLGSLGFYNCYIKNLHVDGQPFYELIKDTTPFKWTDQDEELRKQIKTWISGDTLLAVPSIEHSFHIHIDSSNAGTGCLLVQQFPEGKGIVSLILEFSITLNRRCQPSIVKYMRWYLQYKRLYIIFLAHFFRSISSLITNQLVASGEETDNNPTNFSNTKSLSQTFTTSKSSGNQDPTRISWRSQPKLDTFRSKSTSTSA